MPNSQFVGDELLLLPDAFNALRAHFKSREGFEAEYKHIADPLEKIHFLRLASVYKNLVKDGNFSVPLETLSKSDINFYDVTYKYIALISIIEAVFVKDDWLDFYRWLSRSSKKMKVFPIEDQNALDNLYEQYNSEYGVIRNTVKFFKALEIDEQNFLKTKLARFSVNDGKVSEIESTISDIAKLLYDIRSQFMHRAKLIVEFDDIPSITINRKQIKPFTSTLTLSQLMRVFEIGFIRHFGMRPERKMPLF